MSNISTPPAVFALILVSLAGRTAGAAQTVTPDTFIRAETDREFHAFVANAGNKINTFYYIRNPVPLDGQSVVRMNRDTLYMAAVVDTQGGATVTIPAGERNRYMSALILDNDHYAPQVLYEPGVHSLDQSTKFVTVAVRIQVKNPADPAEIAAVNRLQDQFIIKAHSADPLPPYLWDSASLDALRAGYEKQFQRYQQYAPDWQGKRGEVNEQTRHLAAAGAWGLFPEKDAVYINYSGGQGTDTCYRATYEVPDNKAFWSITLYGKDGYMKTDNNIVNSSNVKLNASGTFTVYFGSVAQCGNKPNRVDVTDGWNYLMRIYRPGASVLSRTYTLPTPVAIAGD